MAITWKWGGTAIADTRASGAVWTVDDYEIGSLVMEPRVQALQLLDGERETYAPLPGAARSWRLAININAAAVTGSSPTDESRAMDAWEEAAAFFDPLDGEAKLEATRLDSDGASVVRHLRASCLDVPQYRGQGYDPQGLGASGAYLPTGAPYLVYVASGMTRFPYWEVATLLATDTAPAAAELDVSGSADTVTINNPGNRWGGLRVVVKAASVSGTVNGFTITNDTHGDVLKITKSTAMAAGEYVDWLATDPRAIDKTSGWKFGTGDNRMRIEPGTQTLSIARTGAGSGTLTLQLSWNSLHYSL